jgi:hypothetical protein
MHVLEHATPDNYAMRTNHLDNRRSASSRNIV